MDDWKPIALLPNADMRFALEGDFAAIVPPSDARIEKLRTDHPKFAELLGKFRSQFGQQVWPAVLLLKADAPDSYRTAEAITAFRDILAAAVVPFARSIRLTTDQPSPLLFSIPFQLYPWMLDNQYEHMMLTNPAELHVHLVEEFQGQTFPEQSHVSIQDHNVDKPLVGELLDRWKVRYSGVQVEWKDKALFRSLNMANEAAGIHALTAATFYDVGRSLALWVSAYEILAHPGGNGQSSYGTVSGLLEKVTWLNNNLSQAIHVVPGNPPQQKQLASWICKKVYNLRNDFLHGNDVAGDALLLNQKIIIDFAPCLFRLALTGLLDLKFSEDAPSTADAEATGKYIAKRMRFNQYQRSFENALLTAI